jgi:hypothetical protein
MKVSIERRAFAVAVSAFGVAGAASAQPGAVPGLDVVLSDVGGASVLQREGTFPTGVNGLGIATTVCNGGSVPVAVDAAMAPSHPFVAFLVARESGGRFVQVSDRSFATHLSAAANGMACGICTAPGVPSILGVGCSTSASEVESGDHFSLGPPGEIDPWFGAWVPTCSHFDRGEPAVAAPGDCDGVRSLDAPQAALLDQGVNHRVRVEDADLDAPGASFWVQAQVVAAGEPEANRENNMGSRRLVSSASGATWTLQVTDPLLPGSILQRWSGASVSSDTNEGEDGRVYVAVKVTGPVEGFYHYEYAVHNRDNSRGVGAFRVPTCPQARTLNLGFRDIDDDPSNDWTAAVTPDEIVFSTPAHPLEWNSIFNFWFDSDAAPELEEVVFDAFAPGPGDPDFDFDALTPTGLWNVWLGPGCGTPQPPTLYAAGSPARALLGNPTFQLRSSGNAPGALCLLAASAITGSQAVPVGCTLFVLGTPYLDIQFFPILVADASGVATFALPVPNDPLGYEGIDIQFQMGEIQLGTGAFIAGLDLSDGILVRVGDQIDPCP